MKKIDEKFILKQYETGVNSYTDFTKEVGLWDSEQFVFTKYIGKSNQILDLGCGTGRTTFPLHQLGYQNIIGVDLTPQMIESAKTLNQHFNTKIDFRIGNAKSLDFSDNAFDVVIFSFNGLMSIPQLKNRKAALQEINRVLKSNGVFIFTTHDREAEPNFLEFWKEEAEKWKAAQQNKALYEFGDIIAPSKNESREIFIHIPNQSEIIDFLSNSNFKVIETFYRSERFTESEQVKVKSGECRFWIARKV
jgi:ubiquinone/menaquinone biosynthesis C-methylase UbiE